jgi:hypothetical protein
MFGMLDYRAHKLFRLLRLPFDIVGKLLICVCIVVAILIAQPTGYNVLLKIVIAYVAFEAIGIFTGVIWLRIVCEAFKRAFFWFVDIVPAHGTNAEEARRIVEGGRQSELILKLERDFGNWTPKDTNELWSLMNWRSRLFFGDRRRRRLNLNIDHLKTIYDRTGQLTLHSIKEALEKYPDGQPPWWELVIVSQGVFIRIVALTIIVVVIGSLPAHDTTSAASSYIPGATTRQTR